MSRDFAVSPGETPDEAGLVASLSEPLVEELPGQIKAAAAFEKLGQLPYCLFLDSALPHDTLGRYSFVAADPFDFCSAPATSHAGGLDNASSNLDSLAERLRRFATATIGDLPPFQGGAAGLFGYDLSRSLERLPAPRFDEFQTPALAVGLYDVVAAFDHAAGRGWLLSTGWPEITARKRKLRAERRLKQFAKLLLQPASRTHQEPAPPVGRAVPAAELAPQFPAWRDRFSRLTSNFDRAGYLAAVRRAVEAIHAGEVFQVNLAQRLLHPAMEPAADLYRRLREKNPATFAAYFDAGAFQILSASPERFVQVADRWVESRPIKGTRRRTAMPEADFYSADELQQSEKDRAENIMIVDLMRNDLSRVCQADSVSVEALCRLESYQFVQHLVSVVRGRLREGCSPIDLVRAAFPGGSITGAPKVRAMELIAELEPTARGAYCGSLGYLGFNGAADLNILIRTITAGRGWWQMPVGGGIVAQSEPVAEYEETWHKAEGLLRALPDEARG